MKTKKTPPIELTSAGGIPDTAAHCWRFRVRREVLMKPSLCPHDIAVIDWKATTAAQGQIVAVECTEQNGMNEPEPRKFITFRGRYQLRKGIEVFFSDEKGIIGTHLSYGRWWPVVSIEADELSPYARTGRPEEVRARLAGAEMIEGAIMHSQPLAPGCNPLGPNVGTRAESLAEIAKIIRTLKAQWEVFYQQWDQPKPGRRVR